MFLGVQEMSSLENTSPAAEPSSELPNACSPGTTETKTTPERGQENAASGRRRHTKSRTGCVTCKQRRVKCDEDTPICGNCLKGRRKCHYPYPVVAKEDAPKHVPRSLKPNFFELQTYQQELWLLHHFCHYTAKTMIHDPFGPELNTVYIPQLAILHEHIRHLIFAVTLLHLAHAQPEQSQRFHQLATAYQSRAVSNFQSLLSLGQGSTESCYVFSWLLGLHTWANSRQDRQYGFGSPSSTIMALYRVWQQPWGVPDIFKSVHHRYQAPEGSQVLAQDVTDGLGQLASCLKGHRTHGRDSVQGQCAHLDVLQGAVRVLRQAFEAFAAESRAREALGWLTDSDQGFVDLFETGDRHSRLIVMCFGVLLHHITDDRWWAQDFGKELVDEMSQMAGKDDQESVSIVAWARSRVGLDPSPLSILSISRRR